VWIGKSPTPAYQPYAASDDSDAGPRIRDILERLRTAQTKRSAEQAETSTSLFGNVVGRFSMRQLVVGMWGHRKLVLWARLQRFSVVTSKALSSTDTVTLPYWSNPFSSGEPNACPREADVPLRPDSIREGIDIIPQVNQFAEGERVAPTIRSTSTISGNQVLRGSPAACPLIAAPRPLLLRKI